MVLWLRKGIDADMPTYEYLCQACGSRFETWQKITDDPIETCPTCGDHVHRVLYPVGLVFKGSGFYKTDNRGGSTSSGGSTESSGSSEAKPADTKPAEAKSAEAKPAETKSAATTAGE
jgi:putative FmdB family regulatory protein